MEGLLLDLRNDTVGSNHYRRLVAAARLKRFNPHIKNPIRLKQMGSLK